MLAMLLSFSVASSAIQAEGGDLRLNYQQLEDNVALRQADVLAMEEARGRYHDAMIEPLQQLARAQLAYRRFDDAKLTNDQALRIVRSNHGLYSMKLLPLMEMAMEIDMGRNEWKRVNDSLKHYAWFLQNKFEGSDTYFLQRLDWLVQTHFRGIAGDSGEHEAWHIMSATSVNEYAVRYAQLNRLTEASLYTELLYSLSRAYLYEYQGIKGGGSTGYHLREIIPGLDVLNDKWDAMALRYRIGLEKLQMMRDNLAGRSPADPAAVAMADIHLANWYLRFERTEEQAMALERGLNALAELGYVTSAPMALYAALPSLDRDTLTLEPDGLFAGLPGTHNFSTAIGSD